LSFYAIAWEQLLAAFKEERQQKSAVIAGALHTLSLELATSDALMFSAFPPVLSG